MLTVKSLVQKSLAAVTPYGGIIQFANDDLNDLENTPENAALIADLRALLAACRRNDPQHTIDTLIDKVADHHGERHNTRLIRDIEQRLTDLTDSAENTPLRAAYNVLLTACHNRNERGKEQAFKTLKNEFGIGLHWRDLCIADIQSGVEWATFENIAYHFDEQFARELFKEAGVTP